MNRKDTKVSAVTRPPNQRTSPYAYVKYPINQTDKLDKSGTYDEDDGQVLEYRIHGNR